MYNEMVSIIVPVYNTKKYLKDCLESLLNQTYKNYEIILVDDGSTDGSDVICDKYSKKDKSIKVYHINNSGVSFARNYGIKNSNGKWITFVDSDDIITLDYLESLINSTDEEVDMVIGRTISFINDDINNIIDDGYHGEDYIFKNNSDKEKLYESIFIDNKKIIKYPHVSTCSAKLFRKELLMVNNIIYDLKMKLYEDAFFNLQCINNSRKIKYINKKIYYYRYNNFSSSNRFNNDIVEQYNYLYELLVIYSKNNDLVLNNYINYFKVKNCNIIFTNYFRINKYDKKFIKNIFLKYGEALENTSISILPKKRKILKILFTVKFYYLVYLLYKI